MKIFVTYSNTPNCIDFGDSPHEEFLKKPDVFIPILGGKALYKGPREFFKNMKGDNEGQNVSVFNNYINEHSVIFWAGHNLNEIDADYIGFCHYRRLFDVPDGEEIDKDTIYINPFNTVVCNATYFLVNHDGHTNQVWADFINKYMRIVDEKTKFLLIKWLNSPDFFSSNMFIMHTDRFKEYMKLMQPIYGLLLNTIVPQPNVSDRSVGFILERMNSFIIRLMAESDSSIKLKNGKYVKLDEDLRT